MGFFFCPRQDESGCFGEELVLISLFFCQQFETELVVRVFQLLVHASHHSNIVVVNKVNFLEVEDFRKATSFICEEEISNSLSLEWQSST